MKSYRTVKGTAEAVYEIQKSRFLTHVSHAGSEQEARAFIQARKKEFFDARHNCSAYVLGAEGAKQKSNDDGEPGGTAGNPMLEAIKQKGLTDVVVVVTRYFGGIKLGAGGLIRAYSHSAVLGLKAAELVEMTPFAVVHLHLDYSLLAPVERYLRQQGGPHGGRRLCGARHDAALAARRGAGRGLRRAHGPHRRTLPPRGGGRACARRPAGRVRDQRQEEIKAACDREKGSVTGCSCVCGHSPRLAVK